VKLPLLVGTAVAATTSCGSAETTASLRSFLSDGASQTTTTPEVVFSAPSSEGAEWDVQVPEEIIREAKQLVLERRCEVDDLDDEATLDRFWLKQVKEGRMRVHMPNNRVVLADAYLSRTVLNDLHDDCSDHIKDNILADRRQSCYNNGNGLVPMSRASSHFPQPPQKLRNPWYLPPATWYGGATGRSTVSRDGARSLRRNGLSSGSGIPGLGHEDGPRASTESDKVDCRIAVEAYMQSLKEGQRLPRFLK